MELFSFVVLFILNAQYMQNVNINITKILEDSNIPYRLLPHQKPVYTCEIAAAERGVPLDEMIKCLVLINEKDNTPLMTCVTADKRVSLSKIKKLLGTKSLRMASDSEIFEKTGFIRGSIAPIGVPDNLLILADFLIQTKEKVNISTGDPSVGVEIPIADFNKIFKGEYHDIAEK